MLEISQGLEIGHPGPPTHPSRTVFNDPANVTACRSVYQLPIITSVPRLLCAH